MLKALILSIVPAPELEPVLQTFRGAQAHSSNRLKAQYTSRGGSQIPHVLSRDFTLVDSWSTDLRYEPANLKDNEARKFVVATGKIIEWAEGRL